MMGHLSGLGHFVSLLCCRTTTFAVGVALPFTSGTLQITLKPHPTFSNGQHIKQDPNSNEQNYSSLEIDTIFTHITSNNKPTAKLLKKPPSNIHECIIHFNTVLRSIVSWKRSFGFL